MEKQSSSEAKQPEQDAHQRGLQPDQRALPQAAPHASQQGHSAVPNAVQLQLGPAPVGTPLPNQMFTVLLAPPHAQPSIQHQQGQRFFSVTQASESPQYQQFQAQQQGVASAPVSYILQGAPQQHQQQGSHFTMLPGLHLNASQQQNWQVVHSIQQHGLPLMLQGGNNVTLPFLMQAPPPPAMPQSQATTVIHIPHNPQSFQGQHLILTPAQALELQQHLHLLSSPGQQPAVQPMFQNAMQPTAHTLTMSNVSTQQQPQQHQLFQQQQALPPQSSVTTQPAHSTTAQSQPTFTPLVVQASNPSLQPLQLPSASSPQIQQQQMSVSQVITMPGIVQQGSPNLPLDMLVPIRALPPGAPSGFAMNAPSGPQPSSPVLNPLKAVAMTASSPQSPAAGQSPRVALVGLHVPAEQPSSPKSPPKASGALSGSTGDAGGRGPGPGRSRLAGVEGPAAVLTAGQGAGGAGGGGGKPGRPPGTGSSRPRKRVRPAHHLMEAEAKYSELTQQLQQLETDHRTIRCKAQLLEVLVQCKELQAAHLQLLQQELPCPAEVLLDAGPSGANSSLPQPASTAPEASTQPPVADAPQPLPEASATAAVPPTEETAAPPPAAEAPPPAEEEEATAPTAAPAPAPTTAAPAAPAAPAVVSGAGPSSSLSGPQPFILPLTLPTPQDQAIFQVRCQMIQLQLLANLKELSQFTIEQLSTAVAHAVQQLQPSSVKQEPTTEPGVGVATGQAVAGAGDGSAAGGSGVQGRASTADTQSTDIGVEVQGGGQALMLPAEGGAMDMDVGDASMPITTLQTTSTQGPPTLQPSSTAPGSTSIGPSQPNSTDLERPGLAALVGCLPLIFLCNPLSIAIMGRNLVSPPGNPASEAGPSQPPAPAVVPPALVRSLQMLPALGLSHSQLVLLSNLQAWLQSCLLKQEVMHHHWAGCLRRLMRLENSRKAQSFGVQLGGPLLRQGELFQESVKLLCANQLLVALVTEVLCSRILAPEQLERLMIASWPIFPDLLSLLGAAAVVVNGVTAAASASAATAQPPTAPTTGAEAKPSQPPGSTAPA